MFGFWNQHVTGVAVSDGRTGGDQYLTQPSRPIGYSGWPQNNVYRTVRVSCLLVTHNDFARHQQNISQH